MSIKISSLSGRIVLSLMCLTLPVLGFATMVMAQSVPAESRNWWSPTEDVSRESGKLSELVNRKKVYVVTSFTDSRTIDSPSPIRNADVHRMVVDAFSVYKDLQVVPVPSQADFAVVVRTMATTESGDRPPNFSLALDPTTAIAIEVLVLVPGSKGPDEAIHPRVVWQSSISNAQVEAQSAARSTVDGFLWELSKVKGRLNTKAK